MNQERIGKFIAQCRNEKNLTQAELGSKLGVTEKSISNWENGRNMPDVSLFKPLCKVLDISINELMSGERIAKEEYQEKLEENILNTFDYNRKKLTKKENLIGTIFIVSGILISFFSMVIFPNENNSIIYIYFLGGIFSFLGILKFTKRLDFIRPFLFNLCYIIIFAGFFFLIDYIEVVTYHQIPKFFISKEIYYNMIIYSTPFYDFYRINYDTDNEYDIVDPKNEYTKETVPNTPFNRDKCGIDNLINYKMRDLENATNILELVYHLPLSDSNTTISIDTKDLGLTIHYVVDKFYINSGYYLEKSLLYNAISIFSLIDNIKYIKFEFNGQTYYVTRTMLEEIYPNFQTVAGKRIIKEFFNMYVEEKMNDNDFIQIYYKEIFINENLKRTKKIVVNDKKIIEEEEEIQKLIATLSGFHRIEGNVTLEGHSYTLLLYDEKEELIYTILGWTSTYGLYGKEYGIDYKDIEVYQNILGEM